MPPFLFVIVIVITLNGIIVVAVTDLNIFNLIISNVNAIVIITITIILKSDSTIRLSDLPIKEV